MFDVAATPTVNDAGTPAAIAVVGAARVIPVRGLRLTATVAVFPATFAVTVAFCEVVSSAVAVPKSSVVAVLGESDPASAVNVTATPGTPAPDTFSTRAEIVDVPPLAPSVCGLAESST